LINLYLLLKKQR